MQPEGAFRPLKAHLGQFGLLVMSTERVQGVHDQERRPVVVGVDVGAAFVEFDRLLKIALCERVSGIEIVAFIGIRIQRDSAFEFGDRVVVSADCRQRKAVRGMCFGEVGIELQRLGAGRKQRRFPACQLSRAIRCSPTRANRSTWRR